MAKNKFGTFEGVFTPSILTILGVIMYMRMGWVVGNAGLIGTILIVVVAHIISISTGLSVSSIATDKKVGAGGIYYILSRSMGIPIGGAIGITLYVGTAASIALYLIGFAESINPYFGFSPDLNGLRITGTIALVSLTSIALISTSFALRTQFLILGAIILSLISIFLGTNQFAPETVSMFAGEGAIPLEMVFAIYFPAVTGFTAGIAMSGDLADSKKSIPVGTIAAIAVGFIVYIGLAVFISYYINPEILRTDNNILMKIAFVGPVVAAGIWGATLSSALGGILGGPRILQAMSVDRVTPKIFAKGKGKGNEPINALLLVFVIAEMGILIGELDVIARVVSMFFLSAYGFINLSFFLESWANPDFQPSFKVKRWFGAVGFIACFAVMFKLDMLAMFGAIVVIVGIYFWLQRKQIMLETGDVWQSVWENIVLKGLKKLELKEVASNTWNPNIILFSGKTNARLHLLEFSKAVSGRTGIVTNFNLIINSGENHLSKVNQNVHDTVLDDLGIFGRQVEVENIYTGIETIASTFGFTGIDPNTVMMGWPKKTENPEEYNRMTQKLIHLDYNLLYLDYDERYGFGDYKTIDLWWRGTDNNNAEMMLNIVRLVTQSDKWSKARVRVLFVNNNNSDNGIVKTKILNLVKQLRIDVEVIVINNGVEQKSFYKIIENHSGKTDLIILGIPAIAIEKQAKFILKTNKLFDKIGTTLLVKAANNFNEIVLEVEDNQPQIAAPSLALLPLESSRHSVVNQYVSKLDQGNSDALKDLIHPISSISSLYNQLAGKIEIAYVAVQEKMVVDKSSTEINQEIKSFLLQVIQISEDFQKDGLRTVHELFNKEWYQFISKKNQLLRDAERRFKIDDKQSIPWRELINYYHKTIALPKSQRLLYAFGERSFVAMQDFPEKLISAIQLHVESRKAGLSSEKILKELKETIAELIKKMKLDYIDSNNRFISDLKNNERSFSNLLVKELDYYDSKKQLKEIHKKEIVAYESNIVGFANDWYRNQMLAHNQAELGLSLIVKGILVADADLKIQSEINNVLSPQYKKIDMLSKSIAYIQEHLDGKDISSFKIKHIDELIDSTVHLKLNDIINSDKDQILTSFYGYMKQKELMGMESFNNFSNCQNDDVETVNLDIKNIQSHIIQKVYVTSLESEIQHLEKVFNNNSDEIFSTANLVKHLFEDADGAEKALKKNDLINAKERIEKAKNRLQIALASFTEKMNVHLGNTISELSVRSILNSADDYSKITENPVIQTKIGLWYDNFKIATSNRYAAIKNFIIVRKQEIDVIKFDEKHQLFENKIERTNHFVQTISIDSAVSDELSFYYKKLFTGSHLGKLISRKKELDAVEKAISRIDKGVSGAIMILGTSLSGKTVFTETIAKHLKRDHYVIKHPLKQNYQIKDVENAFLKAIDKKGSLKTILQQLPKKSIFIINDIERWWLKHEDGTKAMNYIIELIKQFGNRHYFLINCNIYSFQAIRKVTAIESQLLATIIMSPASKVDLKQILLARHKTGTTPLWHHNKLVEDGKNMDGFFYQIHDKSRGNIGLALNSWISSIQKNDDDLVIEKPRINIPAIDDSHWKIVLYFILIHQKIRKANLIEIFGSENTYWIEETLEELEKSGLIYKQSYDSYVIIKNARPYIEKRLVDFGILN